MSNNFVAAFEDARDGISLPKIADAMAKRSGKNARGLSGNLYRLVKNNQTPKKQTVIEIADALGNLKKLSGKQKRDLEKRLLEAARPAESQSELRQELRPQCEEALRDVDGLSDFEIASILDRADVATMKLMISASKKGEAIMPLRFPMSDTLIAAGRARILIDGKVTPAQMRVLRNAAEMIESVLQMAA
jgi:hypothetical protein